MLLVVAALASLTTWRAATRAEPTLDAKPTAAETSPPVQQAAYNPRAWIEPQPLPWLPAPPALQPAPEPLLLTPSSPVSPEERVFNESDFDSLFVEDIKPALASLAIEGGSVVQLVAAESPAQAVGSFTFELPPPVEFAPPKLNEGVIVVPPPPPKLWTHRFELGVTGAEGNTRQFATQAAAKAIRQGEMTKLTMDLRYLTTHADYIMTQNAAYYDGRWEIPYANTPWSNFLHNTIEYDEFKGFDYRVTADAGLSYDFLKSAAPLLLQGRTGAGFSREYGGTQDEIVPEVSTGGTYEHQFTKRQKIRLVCDYFWDVRDVNDFRVRSELAWEVKVDEAGSFLLQTSMLDTYDSTPLENFEHNDLTYSVRAVYEY